MYHIYISCAAQDILAAADLHLRLTAFGRQRNSPRLSLDRQLIASRPEDENYLIVVCSPRSVTDPQVEADIHCFCQTCSVTHIVPYVIRGIPNAKEKKKECIPAALRQLGGEELLAANAVTLGRQMAVNKIISSICNIPVDQLARRSQKQRIRRIAATLICIILFLSYTAYSKYTTSSRKECYRQLVYENHVPVGVDRIRFPERLFVRDYYIFQINYHDVLSVTQVGEPSGYTPADPALAAYYSTLNSPIVHFSYHTDGELDAAVHTDADGTIRFVINYTAGMTAADFSTQPDGITEYFLIIDGKQSEFSRCIFSYDEEGKLENVQYALNSRNT